MSRVKIEVTGWKTISFGYTIEKDLNDFIQYAEEIKTPRDLYDFLYDSIYDDEKIDYWEDERDSNLYPDLEVDEELFNRFIELVDGNKSML